jgi:hypothetical protein
LNIRINEITEYKLPIELKDGLEVLHFEFPSSFASFNTGKYIFSPKLGNHIGSAIVSGMIKDKWG